VSDHNIAIHPDLGPDPWLRLAPRQGRDGKTESARACAAFEQYYRSSPGERSLRAVATKVGKHRTLISQWSSRFRWVERTEAWDRRQNEVAAAQYERQLREEEEVWNKRKKALREEKYAVGQQLRERGAFMVSRKTLQKRDASGHPATILKPHRSHAAALALLEGGHELGLDCIRRARPASAEGATADEPAFVLLPAPTKQGGAE